jgi:manganese/iron transport system substrate-binding protein
MAAAIRQAKVPAIFAETTINPALIETVAAESGATLAPDKLYADSIGVAGGPAESYVKMLAQNTRSIVRALGGHDRPFAPSLAPASAPTPSSAPATPR